MEDDDLWVDDQRGSDLNNVGRDNEWAKISSEFTNAGYREGIVAGKESALQSGFDSAFAEIGVPLGRALGLLRGLCSALIAFLSSSSSAPTHLLAEAREIGAALSNIRFSDIVPRDLEAEEHARQHIDLAAGEDLIDDEGIKERRQMEEMEDMMGRLNAETAIVRRPAMGDVQALRERLEKLCAKVGLELELR